MGFFSNFNANSVCNLVGGIGNIFGKKTTQPPATVYPRSPQPVVKKANTNLILIIGGAVLVVVVLIVFLKK